MKQKWKLMISLLACGTILTACGNNKKDEQTEQKVALTTAGEFPIVKEKLTMSMMGPNVGMAEWKDMAFFKDYAKKTNIQFDFTTPPSSDFATKLNLAFASGDIADILFAPGSNALTPAMEMDYGGQGILVALEEMIDENMPNFSKLLKEDSNLKKAITTPDGHIYSLPTIPRSTSAIWGSNPMWLRGDWLEALNVTELPKTTDEFYRLLKRFKEEDPNGNGKADEIPLSSSKDFGIRTWLMGAFGIKGSSNGIEEHNGVVRYYPMTENYKAYLEYANKLYKEGLLDKETFSLSVEQFTAKGQSNQIGAFQTWTAYFVTGQTEKDSMNNPMLAPLTSEIADKPVLPMGLPIGRETFAITNKCPSPEAALRWVDYFYSAEGSDYLINGPEGAYWQWETNDAGEKVRVHTQKDVDPAQYENGRAAAMPAYGLAIPNLSSPADISDIRIEANQEPDATFAEFIKKESDEKIKPYVELAYPTLYLSNEESDQVQATATDLQTYIEQMEAKFITGVEPLDNWDKYVKTIQSMGVDEYVKVYQTAYDRWEKQ